MLSRALLPLALVALALAGCDQRPAPERPAPDEPERFLMMGEDKPIPHEVTEHRIAQFWARGLGERPGELKWYFNQRVLHGIPSGDKLYVTGKPGKYTIRAVSTTHYGHEVVRKERSAVLTIQSGPAD